MNSEQSSSAPAHIAVIGLGYVGCVTAACLAHLGHKVTGVDKEAHKVESIVSGQAPFHEPGLEAMIREGCTAGRLTATTSIIDSISQADAALLCVGTPSESNGNMSVEQLRRVCLEIAPLLPHRTKRLIIAVRSTVFPGTCENVVAEALAHHPMAPVVSNPEFLREGTAVKDFIEPSLLVVGGSDPEVVAFIAGFYRDLPIEPCLVSLRTAEMIKYACNAFHAVKIGFANEIGTLAAELGVDGEEVMNTLCRDVKLNISPTYLRPGFAFGGSCLPKDLRAIVYSSLRLDLDLPLLESTLRSNEQHLRRSIRAAWNQPNVPTGVFGLAFKENTDDLRESPVITLLEQLLAKGRNLRVWDPHIRLDRIYGRNLSFLISALPHIGRLMAPSLDDLLNWSKQLILAQKPSAEDREKILNSGLPVLDVTRIPCPLN